MPPPSHQQADPYAEHPGLQGPPPCTPLRGCCWESPLWPRAAGPLPAVCAQGPGPSARQPSWLSSALSSLPSGNAERGVGGRTWWWRVLRAWEPGAAGGCCSPSFRIQAGCEVGTHALPGAGRARQPLSWHPGQLCSRPGPCVGSGWAPSGVWGWSPWPFWTSVPVTH